MIKIIVSGWAGSGESTLAMTLALLLNIKLLKGSESFRLLWDKLGLSQTGEDIVQAENIVEPHFGPLYDKYTSEILLNSSLDFALESDIAGFLVGKNENFLSVFLTPSIEARKKRLEMDGRPEDIQYLETRDLKHQSTYNKLTGYDFLSMNDIQARHDLVIDSSNVSIAEELNIILEALFNRGILADQNKLEALKSKTEQIDKLFWDKGKQYILHELKEKDLIISGEDTIKAIRERFKDEINKMPDNLKNIILAI